VVDWLSACGYAGAGAMCKPSLEPGGVSSAADWEALAEADAETESCPDRGLRPVQAFEANGFVYEMVAELLLVTELADADTLEFCWCLVLVGAFIVMGVLVEEEE
jgi:hypothetical protein